MKLNLKAAAFGRWLSKKTKVVLAEERGGSNSIHQWFYRKILLTLQKPVHEALRQRITVHYNYEGLSEQETAAYIAHKFALAGAPGIILGEGVLAAVHGYASGNPRTIDSLMAEALTLGAQLGLATLNTDIIMAASNNLALV